MAHWLWDQSAGELWLNGTLVSRGYAGRGKGKNNPAMQAAVAVGPIPQGNWLMTELYDSKNVGPLAIKIVPKAGTDALGRSAFRIHGDSIRDPGSASHGCIILPRVIRQQIWRSGIRDLVVRA